MPVERRENVAMNKRTRTALIVFGVLIVGGVLLGLAYSGYIPIEGAAFVACHTEGCALSADCYGANSSVTAVWGRVEGRLYVDGTQVATGGGNAGRTRKTYSMSASYDPSVPHTVRAEWRYYDTRGNRKPNYDCVREVTVQPCVQPTPTHQLSWQRFLHDELPVQLRRQRWGHRQGRWHLPLLRLRELRRRLL
jgi:hypothetical protein